MINKQDFANFFEQNIEIVKGDTLSFNFQIAGLDGDAPRKTTTTQTPFVLRRADRV